MASSTATSSTATSSMATNNVMLSICEKKISSLDLYPPLRHYIPQILDAELQALNQLRLDVEKSTNSSLPYRRDLLIRYFKALSSVEELTFLFTWFDAFKNKNKCSQARINLEMAAVVFNLGAVFSQLGLTFDRRLADGRRQAGDSFSWASSAFAYLKDSLAVKAARDGSVTVDLSIECTSALERLMLAQAQECVYENAIAKGSSHDICSKISAQVGIYYKEAFAAMNVVTLNQHFDKMWMTQVQLKACLFSAESCFRYCLKLYEKGEICEEIARLEFWISALTDVEKFSTIRGTPIQLLDAVNNLKDNLSKNLKRAVKENDELYLLSAPSSSSLIPLPAISKVNPMSIYEVLDARKEEIFARIGPNSTAEALPRYTEMDDKFIKTLVERLQRGSELARCRLKEMHLPDLIDYPEELKDEVEAVQSRGGPAGLEAELQKLRHSRMVSNDLLVQTEEMLHSQELALTKNLQERLNRFSAKLQQAADSEGGIEGSMKEHSALMSILDRYPIKAGLEKLIMSFDANNAAVVTALKQNLRKLETLGTKQGDLEDTLNEMKRKDDTLPIYLTSTGSHSDLIEKVTAKYDKISKEIYEYIETQEQIWKHIQAQSRQLSAIFSIDDYKASREKWYKQIEAALAKYGEIKEKIKTGLKSSATLQDAINDVKQQCSDLVMTRNINYDDAAQCQQETRNEQLCKEIEEKKTEEERTDGPKRGGTTIDTRRSLWYRIFIVFLTILVPAIGNMVHQNNDNMNYWASLFIPATAPLLAYLSEYLQKFIAPKPAESAPKPADSA